MNIHVYDAVLVIAGLFVGQIVGHILIYRFIHPYIVAPYIRRKRERERNAVILSDK